MIGRLGSWLVRGPRGMRWLASGSAVEYVCSGCGHRERKWAGQCTRCQEWNTMKEMVRAARPKTAQKQKLWLGEAAMASAMSLKELGKVDVGKKAPRFGTWSKELDRVLGGGVVPGSVVLIGGEPGVGKSTMVMQICASLTKSATQPVLYVSGEETGQQIRSRVDRLGLIANDPTIEDRIIIDGQTSVDAIVQHMEQLKPSLVVIDSIQTMIASTTDSLPGSTTQIRESAGQLFRACKTIGSAGLLVGHVTKSGEIAGPRLLEHLVDAVLFVEGERLHTHRVIRALKNRFGRTDDAALFEMTDLGLRDALDPSAMFLSSSASSTAAQTGYTVSAVVEANRAFLVETQALVVSRHQDAALIHRATGVPLDRLHLILAVLQKRVRFPAAVHNVYLNVPGGLMIREPAADLALAIALMSSYREWVLPRDVVFIGELGLGGEIRAVPQLARRIVEAARMGYTMCVVPKVEGLVESLPNDVKKTVKLRMVGMVDEAVQEAKRRSFVREQTELGE